jgi:hypothetical protein
MIDESFKIERGWIIDSPVKISIRIINKRKNNGA